jgi:Ner family transcriptional regulator
MHPEDIKAALRKRGTTMAKIARSLNVSQTTVHNVVHGACTSDRVARAIADVVGQDRADLWPGQYPPVADRIRAAA